MLKLFLSYLFYIAIISSSVILAQGSGSIQINGGVISPMSSSKGLTGSIQFNYSINPTINLYIYAGYSNWDKYKTKLQVVRSVYSSDDGPNYFTSYSSDDHILIPVYIGSRINYNTTKLFTSFVDLEIGYSSLSYNSYGNLIIRHPETGEIVDYQADVTNKKEIQENLFGLGVGAGLSHPMSENLNLILSFKLNTFINSNYFGLFSTKGTYTIFMAGFNYNI